MKFILKMALRETRAGWRRLIFYFVCVAIGTGAIVLLRSAIRNFYDVMASDARSILAADVQIDSARPWTTENLRALDRVAKPPLVQGRTETIEAATMLRPADPTREGALMVDLKGIEPNYPFYGEIQLADGLKFDTRLLSDRGILVARPVLDRLHLKTGDAVKIGDLIFTIRGIIEREPGTGMGFRYGPRVLCERSAIESAGLAGFGSRARRRILLKAPQADVKQLVTGIRKELNTNLIRVRSYRDSQENIDEQYTRAENFLALTGLIILVLGGIGISSVTRVFIEQKRKTIAVLKCVGATGRRVIAAYLVQVLTLGFAGSVLGIFLARIGIQIIKHYYVDSLPPTISYQLQNGAILQGIGVGLLVTILFSAVPLLRIRRIKPNVLLRDEDESADSKFDFVRWITAALVSIGLALLSTWQAGSLKTGLFFLGGLVVASGALYGSAILLVLAIRRFWRPVSFTVRHAINSLHRPGNQTRVIIMSIGLGVFFMVAAQSIKVNLLREFDFERRGNMANLYLIDIQTDQQQAVQELIRKETGEKAELIPTVRSRIFAINGTVVDPENPDQKKDRGRLGFEYTMTYRSTLQPNETVTAGKFWDNAPSKDPEISIEEGMKGMMGLDVGGSITFDIAGRKITARVTSLRRVDWRNSRTGFYVVFRPGVLENAPQMLIAALDGPSNDVQRSKFQRALVDQFPNLTIIDVIDILEGVRKLIRNITVGVSFISGFVFFSGVLILVGSIAMTKFQRLYEAAVLKTLGAKRKIILQITIMEYGLLGGVAGMIGALFGMTLSWAVCRWVLEIPFDYSPWIHLAGIAFTAILVIVAGVLSSLDVLTRKPLGILRTE